MFIGSKTKHYYHEFLKQFLPENIDLYVEPFSGTFAIGHMITANKKVYNDIEYYGIEIKADEIHHFDYKNIIEKFDSENTLFYLDPPYYKKEFLYSNNNNFSHQELKDLLSKIKGKFILSYEDCRFIRNLYKDVSIFSYNGNRYELRNEIILTNISI